MCPPALCGRSLGGPLKPVRRSGRRNITSPYVCDDLLNLPHREEIFVLDRYFIRPTTVDRIRSSWIGDAIERYVSWLTEQKYATRSIFIRVPLLIRFGESAQRAGAKILADLPAHVEPFVNALYATPRW